MLQQILNATNIGLQMVTWITTWISSSHWANQEISLSWSLIT